MKPHPKIRKTIKWTGAAVTVLLVVAWIAGGRVGAYWMCHNGARIGFLRGALLVDWFPSGLRVSGRGLEKGFSLFSEPELQSQGWMSVHDRGMGPTILVPLWMLAVFALIPTWFAWRRDALANRRVRLNLCPKCNYDRTGLAAGAVCPECGSGGVTA